MSAPAIPPGPDLVARKAATSISQALTNFSMARPVGTTLVTGSGAGTNAYISVTPIPLTGTLATVDIFAIATGNLTIHQYSMSGGVLTRLGSTAYPITAVGQNTVTVNLAVTAGQYIGFDGNLVATTSGQDLQWYFMSYLGGPVTTPRDGYLFQIRFNFVASTQITAKMFADLKQATSDANAASSPLAKKRVGVLGDSLSSLFDWLTPFLARSQSYLYWRDARPGRTFACALEGYGASYPLASIASLTGYNGAVDLNVANGGYTYNGVLSSFNSNTNTSVPPSALANPANGTTLASILQQLDQLIIPLGTNDVPKYVMPELVGTPGDAYTAGTLNASFNFVLDTVATLAPQLQVLGVTNTYATANARTYADCRTCADAMIAAFKLRGYPVLDLMAESGINTLNSASRLNNDGLHWNTAQLPIVGKAIAEFAKRKA